MNMELIGSIVQVFGKGLLWLWLVVAIAFALFALYMYYLKDWVDYRRAKIEIESYVKAYKRRCTGNNRFEVTVETLQDVFREYDTKVINRVWLELIDGKLVVQDPYDQTWCIR